MKLLSLLPALAYLTGALAKEPLGPKSWYLEDSFDKFQQNAIVNNLFEVKEFGEEDKDKDCPPCFNCNLPNHRCAQFSKCNTFTGMCECHEGFGGSDCSEPLCGSLARDNSKRPPRGNETSCSCDDGWDGINCNICTDDSVCDAFMPEGLKGVCYQRGVVINEIHQMCNVTNPKIIKILEGEIPKLPLDVESFFCDLSSCKFDYDLESNTTRYNCDNVACECLPGRMLCGKSGSIDISEFLEKTIKGPGDFTCDITGGECRFSEPSMNGLISSVFGDPYIMIKCKAGECVHKSEIPGYDLPDRSKFTWYNLFTIAAVVAVVGVAIITSIYHIKNSPLFKTGSLSGYDDDNDFNPLNENFTPTTLSFKDVSYHLGGGSQVLNSIYGLVNPGECLAIMGGSGAGKTTLLDILAGKRKSGKTSGEIFVNGQVLDRHDYRKIVGFVDQEDHLIPTLTVYETVLNSALLRLPKIMPLHSKISRVIEVLNELRILNIKDRVVGSDFNRGISGGEKRRVSIACELVTSPSILFLDEPTSGLDAYNARNVVDCLVKLAKNYNRTIVFTIHQPRSNIVSLFHKLLLLSEGDLIYSGDLIKANDFFSKHGYRSQRDNGDKLIQLHKKLPQTFNESVLAIELKQEIEESKQSSAALDVSHHLLKKASLFTQFTVLSSRTFKNLYRNPKLLLTNYVLSLLVGLFCGSLYYKVSNDISGFQNRLGLFFFVLALFGFSSLTGLHSFAEERIIFIRERANNYYNPFSYYVSKVLCDIIPLRHFVPTCGLTMEHNGFLKALLVLVVFNVAIASEVLIVGILIKDPGTSTISAVLILLFSMLFAGLFINSEDLKVQTKWLQWISLFHYAYEALAINEVKDLILKEKKYGLSIEVPGAVILSTFGFEVSAYWKDVSYLIGWAATFLVLGYVFLHFLTYERR
ncbi:uncharacterized protein CXQ87_002303 [Candidozyma duobushaemuli]|uniref:ABC transporter domain-containing protein n=1 Tax=Candidozyma duobushaemuli TaxID=1231522 RepID=A0A2V1A875_9ASCO|nr:uncharacterized protein CXQ87_002303 [[Candida] duobushaemulonis]PVH14178.1 hypothetical protein CXQ87_002303 [[Candida] duobushaemulonis]